MRSLFLGLLLVLISLQPATVEGHNRGTALLQDKLDIKLYLPVVFHIPAPNFEAEPNNSRNQANGPLLSGVNYAGAPNDSFDIYYFDATQTGAMTAVLTDHLGKGVQLQLHSAISTIPLDYVYTPPYSLEYNITGLGRYYIVIYTESGFSTSGIYHLQITLPE